MNTAGTSPSPSTTDHTMTPAVMLWMLVCVAGGAWLRLRALDARPLWTDEFTTLITALRPWRDALFNLQDPQPPLYTWLLRPFLHGSHPPEWLLRLPALLAGCLVVPAIGWMAYSLANRRVAAAAILLAAVNPVLVDYSREARPYTLFILATTLTLTCLHRLLDRGGTAMFLGVVAGIAAMMHSHFYAILYLAAFLVFTLLTWAANPPRTPGRNHAAAGTGAVLLGGLLSIVPIAILRHMAVAGMPGAWWIRPMTVGEGLDALGWLMGAAPLGAVCLVPVLAAFWPWRNRLDDDLAPPRAGPRDWWRRRQPALLCASAVVAGFLLPLAITVAWRPGFVPRYALPVLGPAIVLGLLYLDRADRRAALFVVLLLVAAGGPKSWNMARPEKGLRDAAAFLLRHSPPDATLHVMDWQAPPAFKADFIHPEVTGLTYHGVDARRLVVLPQPPIWDPARLADWHAPDGEFWAVGFGSTVRPLVDHMTQQGHLTRQWTFGHDTRAVRVVHVADR